MSNPVTTGRGVRQNFERPVRISASRIGARFLFTAAAAAALVAATVATLPVPGSVAIAAERSSTTMRSASSRLEMARQARGAQLIASTRAAAAFDDNATDASSAFSSSTKLQAADGVAGDHFGGSVAISGTTAVVGANANSAAGTGIGAAYVYTLSGGQWVLQQKIVPADGERDDSFGFSVGISGDTVVVGAFGDTVGTNVLQGSVYVYTRSGSTWTQQAKLLAGDGAANDIFGRAVAIDGDTVVAGALSANIGTNVDQGAAYVFTRSGAAWTQQSKLTAADGATSDSFGDSVSISGNSVVVGATEDAIGANTQQGSAYVFTRSGSAWTQQAKLAANDGTATDYFGFSSSISGDTIAIGTLQNVGANFQQGSAYIFVRSGTTWTLQQKLLAGDGAANDSFGNDVYVLGDNVMIGAAGDTNGANAGQGSAYLFTRSGSNWTQVQKLVASDGAAHDEFGAGVAFNGNSAIVGSTSDTIGSNSSQGSAYIFSSAVSVSGHVTSPSGQNLRNVVVTMIDGAGVRRTATTSSFGIYTFDNVPTGATYTITASSKRYRFSPLTQVVNSSSISNADLIGLE